jgi:hypothetical protein
MLRRGMECSFSLQKKGLTFRHNKREPFMAVLHHNVRSTHETNTCAVKFCLTWVGFFVALGVATYLISLL